MDDASRQPAAGDLLFVRGRALPHRMLGLVDGVSHVAFAFRAEDGALWASSMSMRSGRRDLKPLGEWLRKWDYVSVVRPRGAVDERALAEEATRPWRYSLIARSGHTYCTAHARQMLRAAWKQPAPHRGMLPSSLRESGEEVLAWGPRYDERFARRALAAVALSLLLATAIRTSALRRYPPDRA